MKGSLAAIAMCGLLIMGTAAYAGPCDMKDAGSGPTPGANARAPTAPDMNAGKPKDAGRSEQHPPTGIASKELGTAPLLRRTCVTRPRANQPPPNWPRERKLLTADRSAHNARKKSLPA